MRPKPPLSVPSLPRVPFALALRRRPRRRRALAVAASVLVGLLVAGTVSGADRVRAAWGPTATVAVAAHDLAPGDVVGPGDVAPQRVPSAIVPPGALDDAAVGRTIRRGVLRGEVLVRRDLAAPGATGVAARLPPGTRAVAVPIEPGTAPPLRIGQAVDVVAVAKGADGAAPGFVLSEAAPVVDVRTGAASVAVAPEVVPRIAVALAEGAVSLALVAPG